jgi:hypothetical protein
MEADRRPDYAMPPQAGRRPYWVIFFAAWILSLPFANILDQELKRHLYGGQADGGVTLLSIFAIVPAIVTAAFAKRSWWMAAITGGVCSPLAVIAIYYL